MTIEDYRHGNVYGDFLNQEPNKKEKLLLMLGVPHNKLPKYLEKIESLIGDDKTISGIGNKQTANQIFAVIDGRKPMWFGSPTNISKLGIIKTVLMKNLSNLGLVYYTNKSEAVLGKTKNVERIIPEIERFLSSGNEVPDKQFHKAMGLALGYPAKDVETFLKRQNRKVVVS